MKKGQSALEYLVTYGWAILIIVIIAAVLWYFGVFNPSKWTSNKQCGGFSGVQCIDYTAPEGGNASIVVGNAVGRPINVTQFAIGGAVNSSTGGIKITPNQQMKFSSNTTNTIGSSVGGQYVVWLFYTDLTSGLAHNDTGFVKAQ